MLVVGLAGNSEVIGKDTMVVSRYIWIEREGLDRREELKHSTVRLDENGVKDGVSFP